MTSEEFAKRITTHATLWLAEGPGGCFDNAIRLAKDYLALKERHAEFVQANDTLSRSADHWRQRYVAENSELLRLREQVKREKADAQHWQSCFAFQVDLTNRVRSILSIDNGVPLDRGAEGVVEELHRLRLKCHDQETKPAEKGQKAVEWEEEDVPLRLVSLFGDGDPHIGARLLTEKLPKGAYATWRAPVPAGMCRLRWPKVTP